MMKYLPNKILLIIAVVCIGVWFWFNKPTKVVKENTVEETTEESIIDNSLPKQKPETESVFDYSAENSNDKVNFKVENISFELNRVGDYNTTLKVKLSNKTILSNNYNSYVLDVFKIKWKEKVIVIINYFSGGAHCCTVAIPYLVDSDKVVEGKSIFLGNTSSLVDGSFFIKNDKLYAYKSDDRFSYFEMDYATSSNTMRSPYFAELKTDPLEFVESNEQFVDIYTQLYKVSQKSAKKLLTTDYCGQTEEYKKYEGLGNIINRYALGYFSKIDREKLKSELKTDWWCFPEKDFTKTEDDIFYKLSEGDTALLSSASKKKIIDFVNKFEDKIKNRDRSIIELFTEPQTTDDKNTLAYLKEDIGGQMRIFSIALFSYELLDYKIVDIRMTDFTTEVVVSEKLNNYNNTNGNWFETSGNYIIELEKVGREYAVTNFYRENTPQNKYNGLYLL